ncbi:MAG: hypothetical protein WCK58_13200, partial [Chloroflexota bacterium]
MRARAAVSLTAAALLIGTTIGGCGSTAPTPVPATPTAAAPSATAPATPSATPIPTDTPVTDTVSLGNLPTGGAVTDDGRFLWTVSAGFGANDIRIVDTATRQVCQTIPVAGASGGIALDSAHKLAFVSGITMSRWRPSEVNLPGAKGNVVVVYRFTDTCGEAVFDRLIELPPPANAPILQQYPPIPQRSVEPGTTSSWPQQVAVSPDGSHLLVALNLADTAAVVDLGSAGTADTVHYVQLEAASYAFGAAILPDGKTGLVTGEATGMLSVIDLATATLERDIAIGAPLSHPQGVTVDTEGKRAYIAMSASDLVTVVDLATRTVERTISVGRAAGLGTQPVAVALDPDGTRLFVAESGANEVAVVGIPAPTATTATAEDWKVIGRVPTADTPQAVAMVPAHDGTPVELAWISGRGLDVGPNSTGPN